MATAKAKTRRLSGPRLVKAAARARARRHIIKAAAKHGLVVAKAPSPRNGALKNSLRRGLSEALSGKTQPICQLWDN